MRGSACYALDAMTEWRHQLAAIAINVVTVALVWWRLFSVIVLWVGPFVLVMFLLRLVLGLEH